MYRRNCWWKPSWRIIVTRAAIWDFDPGPNFRSSELAETARRPVFHEEFSAAWVFDVEDHGNPSWKHRAIRLKNRVVLIWEHLHSHKMPYGHQVIKKLKTCYMFCIFVAHSSIFVSSIRSVFSVGLDHSFDLHFVRDIPAAPLVRLVFIWIKWRGDGMTWVVEKVVCGSISRSTSLYI